MFIEYLTKYYPFYKGRGKLASSNIFRVSDNQPKLGKLTTGEDIYIYPNDYIGRMVLFFGDLDPVISTFILKNVNEGDIVIDIGANVGVITLPLLTKVGKTGKVISVEPNKNIVELLQKSIKENNFSNIEIIDKGLSNCSGNAQFIIPQNSLGSAKISEKNLTNGETIELIKLDDLNSYVDINKPVKLIKIDVEGHEDKVLEGGVNFINQYDPSIIVFESHKSRGFPFEREEFNILRKLKYEIFELRRGFLMKIQLVKIDFSITDYMPESFDFIAVKPNTHLEI